MALCSRHGHEGEREKTLEGRSMVSGFFVVDTGKGQDLMFQSTVAPSAG